MFKYFLPLLFLAAACSSGHKADYEVQAELQMIDTLNQRLQTVKSWLDRMSLDEIKERKSIISHNFEFLEQEFVEQKITVDEENSRLLDEYRGYGKLYKRSLDSFKPIVMETEELFKQLKTLKESAHSKDYKKETFIQYFNKEKADVLTLYEYASTVLKPIIDTDLDFERAEKKVEELCQSLKESSEK
ncbi:MAG TPA: hypothetical protein VGF79_05300 [Bacteroidia bacterium]